MILVATETNKHQSFQSGGLGKMPRPSVKRHTSAHFWQQSLPALWEGKQFVHAVVFRVLFFLQEVEASIRKKNRYHFGFQTSNC